MDLNAFDFDVTTSYGKQSETLNEFDATIDSTFISITFYDNEITTPFESAGDYTENGTLKPWIDEHEFNFEDNLADKICLSIYLIFALILSTIANGLVIYLTNKYEQMREPYMYIRAVYAGFDIALAWGLAPQFLLNINFDNIPERVTCLGTDFGIGIFFATAQLTAYIALERYVYFCKPMLYHRYFNKKSITAVAGVIFMVTQGYVYVTEFLYGREIQPLFSICQLSQQGSQSLIQLVIFFVPAMVCTGFSAFRIHALMKSVQDNQLGVMGSLQKLSEPVLRRKAAKKALR